MTGGVVSSLGKGLTMASLGLLLESRGLKISVLKLDPYLNIDPGTMNPFQHGEVFVTDDGAETDLDLGHYHRFTNAIISKKSNATSGQIYDSVLKKERKGDYLGSTVQVIPHITDEIKSRIKDSYASQKDIDVVLIEIGGTVGDIESLPFLEAIRQFKHEHSGDCINIHLTYVPYLKAAGELKTKPTQHSVQVLREIGIIPDLILCRCENPLPQDIKEKISLFCSVDVSSVFDEPDIDTTIYEVPIKLSEEKLDQKVFELLKLPLQPSNTTKWDEMLFKQKNPKQCCTIAIIGKYIAHQDAYKSVFEALNHAAFENETNLTILPIDVESLCDDDAIEKALENVNAVLIPGGFGARGFENMILVAKYCRENTLPYFGICLGMQILAIEFARHVLDLKDANSTEIAKNTPHPVIALLSEQEVITNLGGSMRLGSYECSLKKGSQTHNIYKLDEITERHRHRYEFNALYKEKFEEKGLIMAGTLKNNFLCEILENSNHPWMIGVQFHPEFVSKPTKAHPLFIDFVKTALKVKCSPKLQMAARFE